MSTTNVPPPQGPQPTQNPGLELDNIFAPSNGTSIDSDLDSILGDVAKKDSLRAQGLWENLSYGTQSLAKAIGDGVAHIGTFGAKMAGGVVGGLEDASLQSMRSPQRDGFAQGYEDVSKSFEQTMGTRDPGATDLMARIGGYEHQPGQPSIGQRIDRELDEKLGAWNALPKTIGYLTSFVTGPGALVGQGGANLARPLTAAVDTAAAKFVLSKSGVAGEAAKKLIEQGRAWEVLATDPKIARSLMSVTGLMQRGGKNITSFMDMAAANVAQSYVMSPDSDRANATTMALALSVPFYGAAKLGDAVQAGMRKWGLTAAQQKTIQKGLEDYQAGKLDEGAIYDLVTANTGKASRAAAAAMAGALEGSAFTFMSPEARRDFMPALRGDSDAQARLIAQMVGTIGMVGFLKYGMPIETLPHFKEARPDLNNLNTYIEAEAAKRAALGEPAEVAAMPGETVGKPMDAEALQRAGQDPPGQDPAKAPFLLDSQPAGDKGVNRFADAFKDATTSHQTALAKRYGWANEPSMGLVHAGWTPKFEADGSVGLVFGRDHEISLTQRDGKVAVEMDASVERTLADMGLTTDRYGEREVMAGTRTRYTGASAREMLQDLAVVSQIRRLQGDLIAQRMNWSETEPGVWRNDVNGREYRTQLDGSFATRENLTKPWSGTESIEAIGGFEKQKFSSPNIDALADWFVIKQAQSPDPLTDALVGQVISMARNGTSAGANNLRQFIDTVPFEVIQERLRPGHDVQMAFDLAALATGNDNPLHTEVAWKRDIQEGWVPQIKQARDQAADDIAGEAGAQMKRNETTKAMEGVSERESEQTGQNLADLGVAGGDPITSNKPFQGDKHVESAREPSQPVAKWTAGADYAAGGKVPERNVLPEAVRQERRAQEREMRREDEAISERLARRYDPTKIKFGDRDSAMSDPFGVGMLYGAIKKLAKNARTKARAKKMDLEWAAEQPRIVEKLSKNGDSKLSRTVKAQNFRRAQIEAEAQTDMRDVQAAYKALPWKERGAMVALDPKGEGEVPALLAAIDGGKATGKMAALGKAAQKVLGTLYKANAKAGGFRAERNATTGEMEQRPLDANRSRHVLPREIGKDLGVVMADPKLRKDFADYVVAQNPNTKMTGDKLAARWEQEFLDLAKNKVSMESPEGDSAVEHLREFSTMPYTWRGHEIFSPKLVNTLSKQIGRQAGRAAEIEFQGQSIPDSTRAELLKQGGLTPEHEAALKTRFGVDRNIEDWIAKKEFQSTGDRDVDATLIQTVRAALTNISGGQAVKPNAMLRIIGQIDSVLRAGKTALNFPLDFGEVVTRAAGEANIGYAIKALKHVIRHPQDVPEAMRRLAAIDQHMTDYSLGEQGFFKWYSQKVSAPGNKIEQLKASVFAKTADLMVEGWAQGKAISRDGALLNEMGYTAAESRALLNGKADKFLVDRFRREFTQKLSSRAQRHETSLLAANPNINAVFRFIQWPIRRMTDLARGLWRFGDAAFVKKDMPLAMLEGRRLARKGFGIALAAPMGQLFSYMLVDALKGENGIDRFVREYREFTMKSYANAVMGQVTGGPMGQLIRTAMDPNNAWSWTNLTAPSSQLYSAFKVMHKLFGGDEVGAAREVMVGTGLLPRDIHQSMALLFASSAATREAISDERLVDGFKRLEGIEFTGSKRKKPQEFYDAIRNGVEYLEKAGTGKEALRMAMEQIRGALDVAPEDSVAGAVDSYMLTRQLDNETRAKLQDFVGDDARMSRIYAHDDKLRMFAKAIRLEEGVHLTPWEKDLEMVAVQAAHGAGDRWRPLAERAVEESAMRLENGEGLGSQITDLAEKMALHPDQVADLFDRRTAKAMMSGYLDTPTLTRRIAANLRSRVKASRAKLRERKMEKRNG